MENNSSHLIYLRGGLLTLSVETSPPLAVPVRALDRLASASKCSKGEERSPEPPTPPHPMNSRSHL